MKFLIVGHAIHRKNTKGEVGGYGPYVREMNLWFKHVNQVRVVAPFSEEPFQSIDLAYDHRNLTFDVIPGLDLTSVRKILLSLCVLPVVFFKVFRGMFWADHIHLRCPGNVGLVGCIAQVCFPFKVKTAKYAGNWDWNSHQPWSYRLQQRLLRNTFLTKKMKVLVYGEWPDKNKNILPFFTATYQESDKKQMQARSFDGLIRLVFVGSLSTGKQPLLSVQAVRRLRAKGINVSLELFGEGPERSKLEKFISEKNLDEFVSLRGNVASEEVKKAFQRSHFLLFISKSEGWPKVVAESMFWGCLPITTAVSCVPYMVGNGDRGELVQPQVDEIVGRVVGLIEDYQLYVKKVENAMGWSRQFTLDFFEKEIKGLLL